VLANGVSAIGQYTDIFILDHFAISRAEIGYYSLATIFIIGATQITGTVQVIATPYFSERSQDPAWLRAQLVKHQGRLAGVSVVVALVVYVLAWGLIPRVYGAPYHAALPYLSILLVKYVVYSSYALTGVALLGMGLVRYNFFVVAVSTPLGFIASYFLLQRFGVAGVAWAQVGANCISFLMVVILMRVALRRARRTHPREIFSVPDTGTWK
jgi:O-antigen/teichoic acid export membrane protein